MALPLLCYYRLVARIAPARGVSRRRQQHHVTTAIPFCHPLLSSAAIATRHSLSPSPPFPSRRQSIIPTRTYCIRPFSSSTSSSLPYESSTSRQQLSLKKAIRPFLRACHPDATQDSSSSSNASSQHAKEVNLRAVQTMNGLVDSLDILIGRCTPPLYSGNNNSTSATMNAKKTWSGSLPELKSRYEIEFLLSPSNASNNDVDDERRKSGRRKKNKDDKAASTLRSITITFPEYLRSNVKRWALTTFRHNHHHDDDDTSASLPNPQEEEAYRTAMQLREHALLEFGRLLNIAGMKMPLDSSPPHSPTGTTHQIISGQRRKEEERWTLADQFLHELGIDPMEEGSGVGQGSTHSSTTPSSSNAYFGRSQSRPSFPFPGQSRSSPSPPPSPPTYSHPQLQQQRTAFINSIPWNQFALDYDNAFRDAQADFITNRLNLYNVNTLEGRERREQMVSSICGRARIMRTSSQQQLQEDDVDEEDIIPEGLDVVAQLVAIRRLSLLLYDNFDHLQMERMGRMWERLVIVFTPPRTFKRGGVQESRHNIGGSRGNRTTLSSSSSSSSMGEDGSSIARRHPGRKLTKWERRKRHREKMMPVSRGWMRHIAKSLLGSKKEMGGGGGGGGGGGEDAVRSTSTNTTNNKTSSSSSSSLPYLMSEPGFKFSYGTTSDQSVGHVTAYIPIDFRDGELVRQLYTHVYDYFDNCCGHVGFLRYGVDGEIRANNVGRQ